MLIPPICLISRRRKSCSPSPVAPMAISDSTHSQSDLLLRHSLHTFGTRGFIVKNSNNAILFSAIIVFSAMTFALVMGCSREGAAKPAAAATAAPQGHPASEPAPAASKTAVGIVAETMDAAGYTYVKVKTDAGEIWAAAGQFKIKVGEKVTVPLDMHMANFRSSTLNRTFPIIYFTSQISKQS